MISRAEKAELKKFIDALPQITAALARHAADDPEAKRLHQTLVALGAGEASTPGAIYLAAGEGAVPERDPGTVEMADADPESVERDQAAQKIILAEQSKGNTITYIEALRRVEMADTGVR
jgi:hypothetical protein